VERVSFHLRASKLPLLKKRRQEYVQIHVEYVHISLHFLYMVTHSPSLLHTIKQVHVQQSLEQWPRFAHVHKLENSHVSAPAHSHELSLIIFDRIF
jgi:hypothetical protein